MNRYAIAGCVALGCLGMVAAGVAEAQARQGQPAPRKKKFTKDLVVTLVTPTTNQEVLQDLADPGLNGVITVRMSSPPRKRDIIDNQNPFNRLTNRVEFFDSSFNRLPGSPRVRGNTFTFDPFTEQQPVLAQGQYTLNLKRSIRNNRGRLLNFGVADYTTTFSVGTDVNKPVLRKISPINRQTNVGLKQKIVVTFNEPVDQSTLISTITVQDNTTNPPTPIPGAGGGTGVTLERNGFDVVFTPDPCFGYPPKTTIGFIMQGEDEPAGGGPPTTAPVTDVFGNGFARDDGLQWVLNPATSFYESPNGVYDPQTGQFRMEFQSVGVKPAPQLVSPGSPQFTATPIANPCNPIVFFPPSCYATGSAINYTVSGGLGQMSIQGIINLFNQGITDLSAMALVPNTPVRLGRPAGVVTDPRWDPATFHTFIYMVDERSKSVMVLDSRNYSVLGRISGFSSPRDVTISTNFGRNATTLWVSDFAAQNAVGVDLNAITVSFTGQPGAGSPCDAIKERQDARVVVPTGRGPTGIAADSFLNSRVMVCNTLDDSVTVFEPTTGTVRNTADVGSTPVDCDYTLIGLGAIRIGMVANQGGLADPLGSISVYVEPPPPPVFPGAVQARDGVESTFTDNVRNPASIHGQQQWINGFGTSIPTRFIIPNTGGKDVSEYSITVSGTFGQSYTASLIQTYEVGFNPSYGVYDPFYPALFMFVAVAGQGAMAGVDYGRPVPAELVRAPGIRRIFGCYTH